MTATASAITSGLRRHPGADGDDRVVAEDVGCRRGRDRSVGALGEPGVPAQPIPVQHPSAAVDEAASTARSRSPSRTSTAPAGARPHAVHGRDGTFQGCERARATATRGGRHGPSGTFDAWLLSC